MIWRRIINYCFASLAILLIITAVSLATSFGTRAWFWGLNQLNGVKIIYQQGTLLDELSLSSVVVDLPSVNLQLTDVVLKLKLPCLWQGKFCIDKLTTAHVQVKQTASLATLPTNISTKAELNISQTVPFSVPLPIRIQGLSIALVEYQSPLANVTVHHFTAQISLNQQQLLLTKPKLASIAAQLFTPVAAQKKQSTQPLALMLPTIRLPLKVKVDELDIAAVKLKNGTQIHHFQNLQLSASMHNSQLNISNFALHAKEYGAVTAQGKFIFAKPFASQLKVDTQLVHMPWWPEIENSAQHVQVQGDWSNLQIKLASTGSLVVNSQFTVNLNQANYPFSFVFDATKLPLPAQYQQPLKSSNLQLTAHGDLTQQQFSLSSMVHGLGFERTQLQLEASHAKQTFVIQSLTLDDSSQKSQLAIQGKMTYGDKFTWQLALSTPGFTLPTITLPQLSNPLDARFAGKLQSTGTWQGQQWQIAITNTNVRGTVNQLPVLMSGDFSVAQNGMMHPGKLIIQAGESKLSLAGYSDQQWHLSGHISVPKLNDWIADAKGTVVGDFSINGDLKQPLLTFNSKLVDGEWQQLASPLLLVTGQLALQQTHQGQLTVSAATLNAGAQTITDSLLTITGDQLNQSLSAHWRGLVAGTVKLKGTWLPKAQQWQGQLLNTQLTYQDVTFKPNQAVSIYYNQRNHNMRIGAHCWQATGMSLCLPNELQISQQSKMAAKFSISDTLVNRLLMPKNLAITGDVTGEISLQNTTHNHLEGQATVNVQAGKLQFNTSEQLNSQWQWSGIAAKFNYAQQQLTSQINVAQQALNGANTPLLSLTSELDVAKQLLTNTKLTVNNFTLTPLGGLLPNITHLQGLLSAQITAKGSLTQPDMVGYVDLSAGELTTINSPSTIEQGQLHIDLKGKTGQLTGNFDVSGKPAKLQGNADWHNRLVLDASLTAEQLDIAVPPQLLVTIKPDLQLHWQNDEVHVAGKLAVLDGLLTLEGLPEGGINVSDDVVMLNTEGKPLIKNTRIGLSTNIDISIANQFKVQGQGFTGQIGGRLSLIQQPNQPLQMFGNLLITDGRYKAYGQNLVIDKGNVSFDGSVTKPYVNIAATRAIKEEDKVVGIRLQGAADALNLTLFSDPIMEQNEVLSYLLRGRGLDAGASSGAATGLALGVGLTNATGWLKQLDKLPLLNNVELDTQGSGEKTQATIGGYLGQRTYLKYGIGVFTPINELTVRFYLFNRIWVEAVSSIQNSVDLYYSFDVK